MCKLKNRQCSALELNAKGTQFGLIALSVIQVLRLQERKKESAFT